MKKLEAMLAGTLALLFISQAHADTCHGRINGVAISAETIEVAPGHTMVIFVNTSITTSENSPNNAIGKCGGYLLTTPDGRTRMGGVCARKTKDGDSWSDIWSLEPGADKGTWAQSGGTGVFAGKSWKGWWQPVFDNGNAFMGKWGGDCD